MSFVIRSLGSKMDRSNIGCFLAEYDPDAHGGRGQAQWTASPEAAMLFVSKEAAFSCWRQQSRIRSTRPDGHPNRPLTSYTVEILPLVEVVAQ